MAFDITMKSTHGLMQEARATYPGFLFNLFVI